MRLLREGNICILGVYHLAIERAFMECNANEFDLDNAFLSQKPGD